MIEDWLRAIAAIGGILAPVVALVVWLLKRESDRSDRMVVMLENHFRHDEAAQNELLTALQHINEALAVLLDRSR